MSRENVERALAATEAWNRGELEAGLALCDPDIEWVTSGVFPGLDLIYRGHDGFRKFWHDFRSPWETIHIALHDVQGHGDVVVLRFTFEARGRDGLQVRRRGGNVGTWRDGLLVRNETFADWESTLRAAGLPASAPVDYD